MLDISSNDSYGGAATTPLGHSDSEGNDLNDVSGDDRESEAGRADDLAPQRFWEEMCQAPPYSGPSGTGMGKKAPVTATGANTDQHGSGDAQDDDLYRRSGVEVEVLPPGPVRRPRSGARSAGSRAGGSNGWMSLDHTLQQNHDGSPRGYNGAPPSAPPSPEPPSPVSYTHLTLPTSDLV